MADTPPSIVPQNPTFQKEARPSRPSRRELRRSQSAPEPARPSFAERQAALGTPLMQTPDYKDQIKVLFTDDKTGQTLLLNKGQIRVASTPRPTLMEAGHLPRKGDEIEAGGFVFEVKAIRWLYTASGVPLVKLLLQLLAKT